MHCLSTRSSVLLQTDQPRDSTVDDSGSVISCGSSLRRLSWRGGASSECPSLNRDQEKATAVCMAWHNEKRLGERVDDTDGANGVVERAMQCHERRASPCIGSKQNDHGVQARREWRRMKYRRNAEATGSRLAKAADV
mmetsp:Transcript_61820/g.134265  ORF Transcript_61820/g.134265 Transcript_61820/m.134265 type:complete len:138 (-) Transcript_61820:309-722(-)